MKTEKLEVPVAINERGILAPWGKGRVALSRSFMTSHCNFTDVSPFVDSFFIASGHSLPLGLKREWVSSGVYLSIPRGY